MAEDKKKGIKPIFDGKAAPPGKVEAAPKPTMKPDISDNPLDGLPVDPPARGKGKSNNGFEL